MAQMIQVNGKKEKVSEQMTIAGYLKEKEYRMDCIAAELNGEIVPKAQYEETLLQEGDVLEVVSFVGGG